MAICVFAGSRTSFNVLLDVRNTGKLVSDAHDLHLVTTEPEAFSDETNDVFRVISPTEVSAKSDEWSLLRAYLKQYNPSALFQVIDPTRHGLRLGPIAKYYGVPYVYRYPSDTFDAYRAYGDWRKPAYFGLHNVGGRLPLWFASKYVVLGPRGKSHMLQRGADPENVAVLPPPVDPERFEHALTPSADLRAKLDIPTERSIMLFVGRYSHTKGFDCLLEAIQDTLSARDDLHFLLVGGDRTVELPESTDDHVTQVGKVPPKEIPSYFELADTLVLPSRREGLPRVLLESLATGTPVIARDVGEVASVTENTFDERDKFVQMMCDFENLPLDPVEPFTLDGLRDDYLEFFSTLD